MQNIACEEMTISCGHCGGQFPAEDFGWGETGKPLPTDYFRCPGCGYAFYRHHGQGVVSRDGSFYVPGDIEIRETPTAWANTPIGRLL
ncbi:MAG: hypothetical protein M0P69_16930 [Bacteroidales bacterium]|nr:hypothetical protein [Bacteroidales bacterium]